MAHNSPLIANASPYPVRFGNTDPSYVWNLSHRSPLYAPRQRYFGVDSARNQHGPILKEKKTFEPVVQALKRNESHYATGQGNSPKLDIHTLGIINRLMSPRLIDAL